MVIWGDDMWSLPYHISSYNLKVSFYGSLSFPFLTPSTFFSWRLKFFAYLIFILIFNHFPRYRYIIEVPCYIRNVTIERLIPSTEYILTINPVPLEADPDVKSFNVFNSRDRTPDHGVRKMPYVPSAPNVIRFISPQTGKIIIPETLSAFALASGNYLLWTLSKYFLFERWNNFISILI